MKKVHINPRYYKMHYSISRYYIDDFYHHEILKFKDNSLILDVGGIKNNKRGQFNIEEYNLKVKRLNIDPKTKPDYLCDAKKIPITNNFFNGVVCSQLLEHVRNPEVVLKEINRVLVPKGTLLLTVPFMFRIHPDPNDYSRYTDQYWKELLKKIGFRKVIIKKHGLFLSVLADMIKGLIRQLQEEEKPKAKLFRYFITFTAGKFIKFLLRLEQRKYFQKNAFFNSYTIGFGIIAVK